MERITALIQARLGSTRLPGKTLMKAGGDTLLGHLVRRVKASGFIKEIVIATTVDDRDGAIAEFAASMRLKCYRGSEDDVLDRFYKASVKYGLQTIVRVTPDCPILDPDVTDHVIRRYLKKRCDYASNCIIPTYPDGLDTEVFSFKTLEKAWRGARLPSEREHVTAYIVKHPELFSIHNVRNPGEDLSWMRWTVDTEEDMDFIREVFRRLGDKGIFHMKDVAGLLKLHPSMMKLNGGIMRNEGYLRAIEKDGPA